MPKKSEFEGIVLAAIENYESLIDRALKICGSHYGYYASVDEDDLPRLSIDGEMATLTWRTYESDYYGGGYNATETISFPATLLFLDDGEFSDWAARVSAEIKERDEKLKRAQEAVHRDRQEAHERAVYAQLKAKYGP